jgi:farnesyl-diphosphate farnesyltransferase
MPIDRNILRERVLAGDPKVADDFCRQWLGLVSRTFALNIRLLPRELEETVRLAYLLMRIADTVEDDRDMAPQERKSILELFSACFTPEGYDPEAVSDFLSALPSSWRNEAHPDLFLAAHADLVFSTYAGIRPDRREAVRERVQEMCSGMVHYALRRGSDGWFRLETRQELLDYCYFVAGTVGLMLTDLFSEGMGRARKERLRSNSVAFGLALQLVNIARDIPADGVRSTVFVPEEMCRSRGIGPSDLWAPEHRAQAVSVLLDLIRLADREIRRAQAYVLELPATTLRMRLFCLWPLLMAQDTLLVLACDPGAALDPTKRAKIGRRQVRRIQWTTSITCWSNLLLRLQFERRNRALQQRLQETTP